MRKWNAFAVLPEAAFTIYQKSTTRCVTDGACYRKQNRVFRLNATVPCIKSVTLDEHGRQGHCDPVVSAAAERVLCRRRSIGLGNNGMLVACPTTIPKRRHWVKTRIRTGHQAWHFVAFSKFHENFYIVSEVIQGDVHVDTVLLLAKNSGLAVLSVHYSKCTWTKDGCLLSVFVSAVVLSGNGTGWSLVHEFAKDVHRQDL